MNLAGFEKIAKYLSNPLVLVGFVLLLAVTEAIAAPPKTDMPAASLDAAWQELKQASIKEFEQGHIIQAKEICRKILSLGETHQNKEKQGWAFRCLGRVYGGIRGELGKAEEMYRKALTLHEALGSKQVMAPPGTPDAPRYGPTDTDLPEPDSLMIPRTSP